MRFTYLIFSLFCCTFVSCVHSSEKKEELVLDDFSVSVRVEHSAGDDFVYKDGDQERSYLPYISNTAKMVEKNSCDPEFLILSKTLRKGTKLDVRPIGVMQFLEGDQKQFLVLSVPTNKELQSLEIDDFSSFVLKYFSIQQIIQNWYLHRFGFGASNKAEWQKYAVDQLGRIYLRL